MIEPSSTDDPTARLVVPCDDLDDAVDAWQTLGFRLDAIGPADEPTWAELSGPGLRVALDADVDATTDLDADADSGAGVGAGVGRGGPRLRVPAERADPGLRERLGMEVEVEATPAPMAVPPTVQTLAVGHEADGTWKEGRAGMRYRDLIPDRYGGAYIASHIHVPTGGPVPDYVHHHDVVHQLIFCHRGWVRVVYQDQGPPFVLEPGDCVLQPPGIRHRVLEASDDLYVVEIGCPAVHRTSVDHDLQLPNQGLEPHRRYGGQLFARHISERTPWTDADADAGAGATGTIAQQDTGLAAATDGLVSARLLRIDQPGAEWDLTNDDDLHFVFLVSGAATLVGPAGDRTELVEGSSAAVPAGGPYRLIDLDPATVIFEVRSTPPPSA